MPEVVIHYPPLGTKMSVTFIRRVRKAVRERLVALGGEERPSGDIDKIPQRCEPQVREILAEEYPDWVIKVNDERPRQQRSGDRVLWTDESVRYGRDHNGYVGSVRAFAVRYRSSGRYQLYTELPVYLSDEESVFGSEAEAEQAAEKVLARFLARIGARFIENPDF